MNKRIEKKQKARVARLWSRVFSGARLNRHEQRRLSAATAALYALVATNQVLMAQEKILM